MVAAPAPNAGAGAAGCWPELNYLSTWSRITRTRTALTHQLPHLVMSEQRRRRPHDRFRACRQRRRRRTRRATTRLV